MNIYNVMFIKPATDPLLVYQTDDLKLANDFINQKDGTWLAWNKFVIKGRQGTLTIELEDRRPAVMEYLPFGTGRSTGAECIIGNAAPLKVVYFVKNAFTGYDNQLNTLWNATSITDLAEIIDKDLAYEIRQYYDAFIDKHHGGKHK